MPRSGTSLLSRLLHAHPKWAIAPETHYFTRCWDGRPVQDRGHACQLLECALRQPGIRDMQLTESQLSAVREKVEERSSFTHRDIFSALLEMYADAHDASYWGEKTPAHLEYLDAIASIFPEAVFLVMVRDPRDVSLSLRKTPWNQRRTVFDHAGRWARYARRTERFRKAYPNRLETIRYEHLIESPEAVLKEVCQFLNCTFVRGMIPQQEATEVNLDPKREPWKKNALRPIDPNNKEKWRSEMRPVERKIVQWRAGREMEMQGYQVEEIPFKTEMVRPLLGLLIRTVVGKAHRVWHHVVSDRSAMDMPWRLKNSQEAK